MKEEENKEEFFRTLLAIGSSTKGLEVHLDSSLNRFQLMALRTALTLVEKSLDELLLEGRNYD